jgi:hypothetical protein
LLIASFCSDSNFNTVFSIEAKHDPGRLSAIKQFAPAEELDTGGIDPDAYTAELFADYEEAIGTMGLPPDDATYLRYQFNRYRRLFEIRRNNFKKLVVSEKRIPLRLTSAENIDTVIETLRDMELVKTGKLVLRPNGDPSRLLT